MTTDGRVDALADGVAVVLATIDGVTGSALARVALPPVASVTVTPTDPTLDRGDVVTLVAEPRDAAGTALTGRTIVWQAEDEGVAFISSTGRLVAVGTGTTRITATCEGISGSILVTVR